MTGAAEPIFVDTNVLVYCSLRQSPWHLAAIQALHGCIQAGRQLWLSRQVLREYIAVLTRAGMTTLASPALTAAADVTAFETMFHVADETLAVTQNLLALVRSISIGGKQVHDANIVATMQAYGITRLLTHNVADFARFGALITVEPLVPTRA